MKTTAALAAVVLLGGLAFWLLRPGTVHVARTTGTPAGAASGSTAASTDPAATPRPDPQPVPAGGAPAVGAASESFAGRVLPDAPADEPGSGPDTGDAPPAPAQTDAPLEPTVPPPAVSTPPDQGDPHAPIPQPAAALALAAGLPALDLRIPVAGVEADALVDTFTDARSGGRSHDAIDIMAATGTPVLAVADGRIAKLFESRYGGLTVYQFDATGQLAYYYAHLDSYAPGLQEGDAVRSGDPIGTVGYSGNAHPDAPHLHFAIFVLGPERNWWQGTAVNPYPYLAGGR